MSEESANPSAQGEAGNSEPAAVESSRGEASALPPLSAIAEGQQESGTRGILRDAIQKVMDEIEFHEREAKKHLVQAAALRKDLRESVAFLHEQGAERKPAKTAEDSSPSPAAHPHPRGRTKDSTADAKPLRANTKKKHKS